MPKLAASKGGRSNLILVPQEKGLGDEVSFVPIALRLLVAIERVKVTEIAVFLLNLTAEGMEILQQDYELSGLDSCVPGTMKILHREQGVVVQRIYRPILVPSKFM